MNLLVLITVLSFLSASSSHITKPLITWLKRPSRRERELLKEISSLRQQQSQVSMVDDFVIHAKLQRKINCIEIQLQSTSVERTTNSYIHQLVVTYGIRLIFAVILLCVAIYYRHSPVYIFPKSVNFFPLNYIISYPNVEPGALSVPFWLLVSNTVARQIIK